MVMRRHFPARQCKDYERIWKDYCVDKHLQDEWLKKLNDLCCFELISICEGHASERRHALNSRPHINIRLKPEYLASITYLDTPLRDLLCAIAGDTFNSHSTAFSLEWKESLRRQREGFRWTKDLVIRIGSRVSHAEDPDYSLRRDWFLDTMRRIQAFDRQLFAAYDKPAKDQTIPNQTIIYTLKMTQLPFDELPGCIYRSPMPFGPHDPDGRALEEMKQNGVSVVVMLASDEEAWQKAGRDLRKLYQAEGLEVIYLPIEDRCIPDRKDLDKAVDEVITRAFQGKSIAVHCSAGIGRTGLFLAEVAKKVRGLPGESALSWVRRYVQGAVETEEQVEFVLSES